MSPFVIYARKSTESEDRQVLSIDSQSKELADTARRLGLPEPIVMQESMSAKAPGRPVFNKLMELAETGKIAGILCWKLDRLARNPVDGGRIIWSIKNNGLRIITPSQDFSREEDNTILMYIEFGMAQKYIDDLGKNVKRGIRAKLDTGWLPGSAPMGYINKLDDHTIIPDPDRFETVKRMWHKVLEGYPPETVRRMMNDEWGFRSRKTKRTGDRPIGKSSIYRILRSPFYYGVIERKVDGELKRYPGHHLPMITEDQFWRVQEVLGFPTPKPEKQPFPLSGVVRCGECGAAITAEEKIKKSGRRYTYYRCTRRGKRDSCSQRPIAGKELESEVSRTLAGISLPERFTSWAVEWLRETNKDESTDRTTAYKALQEAYNSVQWKLDRLTDMMLENLLTNDEYKHQKDRLLEEQRRLKEKLGDTEQRAENWLERVERAFDFAKYAQTRFENGTPEERRSVAIALGSKFTLKDGNLAIEMFDMWSKFSKMQSQLQSDSKIIELAEKAGTKERTKAFDTLVPSWQGRGESNPR